VLITQQILARPPPASNDDNSADGGAQSASEKSSRVRNVVSKWDHESDNRKDYPRLDVVQPVKSNLTTTFRRAMTTDDDKKLEYEELEVEFDGLKELLARTVNHFIPAQFNADRLKFVSPFREFVWQWSKLEKACDPQPEDSEKQTMARQDLRETMALMQSSESLENYFSTMATHQAGETIT
jgi:hypothetical protein